MITKIMNSETITTTPKWVKSSGNSINIEHPLCQKLCSNKKFFGTKFLLRQKPGPSLSESETIPIFYQIFHGETKSREERKEKKNVEKEENTLLFPRDSVKTTNKPKE